MIIDSLTIAGFAAASSFLLMPILMKREFIRVEIDDEPQTSTTRPRNQLPDNSALTLRSGDIETA
jgi:hypothetical protein